MRYQSFVALLSYASMICCAIGSPHVADQEEKRWSTLIRSQGIKAE